MMAKHKNKNRREGFMLRWRDVDTVCGGGGDGGGDGGDAFYTILRWYVVVCVLYRIMFGCVWLRLGVLIVCHFCLKDKLKYMQERYRRKSRRE